jgi:aminopeptidase N
MKKFFVGFCALVLGFWACTPKTTNVARGVESPKAVTEIQPAGEPFPDTAATFNLGDLGLAGGAAQADTLPVYRNTAKMDNDILHTKLEVKFDWAKQHLLGKATITAKPYFYPVNTLVLDAKSFLIGKITEEGSGKMLKHTYENNKLTIDLGKTYRRDEKYTLNIEYTARPNEGEQGGSDAISSDKGLYFINADGKEEGKPQQIWTQGETESNSRWFPTFDKPNERMTNEIFITTEDKYKTLSNGLMKSSKKNADGTRTDHWVMDMPHAPYLVMMAIGDFVIETEKWQGKDVMYYLEPKYAGMGKKIYKNVPEILSFFSERLGTPYPWQKSAHVATRDYVSGAMENTTAIIYGDFMNGTERELIDKDYNEIVVAHEIFHHWFGDLVTCESWSNLTVNESFADYSESLWLEHKYGSDAGAAHRQEVADGYFGQAETSMHPLVDFQYNSREDMFDAHSYNKGGCILHMLRNYMGDDAFFAGLKKYLADNSYKTGESHQLRLALEEVSGEDLSWFFNQWYFKAGHPVLNIDYAYDEAAKKVNVTVKQIQEGSETIPNVFDLPTNIDIYATEGQKPVRHAVRMTNREQVFSFDAAQKPLLVDFDGDRVLLCQRKDNLTSLEFVQLYNRNPQYLARFEALQGLTANGETAEAQATFKKALDDKWWSLREMAVSNLIIKGDVASADKIAVLAQKDGRSNVRSAALQKLAVTGDSKWVSVFKAALTGEPAYPVIAQAMQSLYKLDAAAALEAAKRFENDENGELLAGVGAIYAEKPNASQLPFFEKNLLKVDGMSSIAFANNYGKLLTEISTDANLVQNLAKLKTMGLEAKSPWQRFGAVRAINEIRKGYKGKAGETFGNITKIISEIAQKETNAQIKGFFMQMIAQ